MNIHWPLMRLQTGHPCRHQRGATLMIALMLLSLLLLLGAATTSLLLLDERAARNHRDHAQARLAAEATLEDACDDIARVRRIDPAMFASPLECRTDADGLGLCLGHPERSGWLPAQMVGARATAAAYGQFTGRRLPNSQGSTSPRYLIESLPGTAGSPAPGMPATAPAPVYRLSAVGYGRNGAMVALQAVVRLSDGEASAASAASGCRWLAWRTLYLPSHE
ncbi:type IV pilus assembly protein PilX [Herbaspirillum frisingense GSF30]|uniref:Type IV pilus assembly protein PilX n=1 Tax=Herbaspirillum frisingense GSF30 TaxID=864073 RepID=A0AAI9ID24_9BURK|nr:pilus assembly protein [Herbaspirillum frisingense]EOA03867.1 type IV pilus assembly protein PilX [Herbaspirillum frisingense GSF30]